MNVDIANCFFYNRCVFILAKRFLRILCPIRAAVITLFVHI